MSIVAQCTVGHIPKIPGTRLTEETMWTGRKSVEQEMLCLCWSFYQYSSNYSFKFLIPELLNCLLCVYTQVLLCSPAWAGAALPENTWPENTLCPSLKARQVAAGELQGSGIAQRALTLPCAENIKQKGRA